MLFFTHEKFILRQRGYLVEHLHSIFIFRVHIVSLDRTSQGRRHIRPR